MLGWRLGFLADKLQKNDLASVRALAKSYAEHERTLVFVSAITITPVGKGETPNV
jgi:hypothetical protein